MWSWWSRVFGQAGFGPTSESELAAGLIAALTSVQGVSGHDAAYQHEPNGSGAVTGWVLVSGPEVFAEVLRATNRALGARSPRVVFYLVGNLPNGGVIATSDLGLSPRPSGAEIRNRLGA
jgi:hypothetical protein